MQRSASTPGLFPVALLVGQDHGLGRWGRRTCRLAVEDRQGEPMNRTELRTRTSCAGRAVGTPAQVMVSRTRVPAAARLLVPGLVLHSDHTSTIGRSDGGCRGRAWRRADEFLPSEACRSGATGGTTGGPGWSERPNDHACVTGKFVLESNGRRSTGRRNDPLVPFLVADFQRGASGETAARHTQIDAPEGFL